MSAFSLSRYTLVFRDCVDLHPSSFPPPFLPSCPSDPLNKFLLQLPALICLRLTTVSILSTVVSSLYPLLPTAVRACASQRRAINSLLFGLNMSSYQYPERSALIRYVMSHLIVKNLQSVLKAEGLPTSGLKAPLQKRLTTRLNFQCPPPPHPPFVWLTDNAFRYR